MEKNLNKKNLIKVIDAKKDKKKIGLFLEDSRISGVAMHTMHFANILNKRFKKKCEIILPKSNSHKFIKLLKKKKILYKFYKIERISKNTFIKYFLFILFRRNKLKNFHNNSNYEMHLIQGSLQFINIIYLNILKKNMAVIIHDAYVQWYFKLFLKTNSGQLQLKKCGHY